MIVSRETGGRLRRYVSLLLDENSRQNLISRSSGEEIWTRHIEDSLQLLHHAPANADWLDIGSGAGLPGIVLAIAGVRRITLVEPRRLRTDFLARVCTELELNNATIITGKAEQLSGTFDVITARAVASLGNLFALGELLVGAGGRWVLPKGRSAEKELAEAGATWQGDFRLEPSITDPEARILVARNVRRRVGRG